MLNTANCLLVSYSPYPLCLFRTNIPVVASWNVLTGIMTIILLQIGLVSPATNITYILFLALLYIGFPFTVLSQVRNFLTHGLSRQ
jgi:hypothetical protein